MALGLGLRHYMWQEASDDSFSSLLVTHHL